MHLMLPPSLLLVSHPFSVQLCQLCCLPSSQAADTCGSLSAFASIVSAGQHAHVGA